MTQPTKTVENFLDRPEVKHTLRLVPSSQRELFVSELVQHLTTYQREQAEQYGVEEVMKDFEKTFHENRLYAQYEEDNGTMLTKWLRNALTQTATKAVEEEAYLWFNKWYDSHIAKQDEKNRFDFSKWATERLQELGASDDHKQKHKHPTGE